MKKSKVFFVVSAIVAVLIYALWLNAQVMPGVAWQNNLETAYTGWEAVFKAWPIYATSGLVAGIIGLFVGLSIGGTQRELNAEKKAERIKKEGENAAIHTAKREAAASQAIKDAEVQMKKATDLSVEAGKREEEVTKLDNICQRRQRQLKEANQKTEHYQNALANATRDLGDNAIDPGLPPWLR